MKWIAKCFLSDNILMLFVANDRKRKKSAHASRAKYLPIETTLLPNKNVFLGKETTLRWLAWVHFLEIAKINLTNTDIVRLYDFLCHDCEQRVDNFWTQIQHVNPCCSARRNAPSPFQQLVIQFPPRSLAIVTHRTRD